MLSSQDHIRPALCVEGKVVTADNHLQAFQQLTETQKDSDLVSGFFDEDSQEFQADQDKDHFYDKEIFLVRHAETKASEDPDPDISDQGVEQVRQLAECFSARKVDDYIGIASPLLRCLHTADILRELLGISFKIMPQVIETPSFLMEDEGFFVKSRKADYPKFGWPDEKGWDFKYEKQDSFQQRVEDTLKHLPSRCIVVTHYGYICMMARLALCDDKAKRLITQGVPPASVTFINRQSVERLGCNASS